MATSQPSKPAWRRPLIVLVLLAVILSSAWWAFERYVIGIERFIPDLVREIEDATGLPASIEALDIAILPTPRLEMYRVVVGAGDFQATAPRVTLDAHVFPLLKKRLIIDAVVIPELDLVIPQSPAAIRKRIEDLAENLTAPSEAPPILRSTVARVRLGNGTIYLDGDDIPYATVEGNGWDILSDTVKVDLAALLPQHGPDALVEATLTVESERGGKVTAILGEGALHGFELATLPLEDAPQATVNGVFTIDGDSPSYIGLYAEGDTTSGAVDALNGQYTGQVWWDHGTLTINDLLWEAQSLHFLAQATWYDDGRVLCVVNQAEVGEDALRYILEDIEFDQFNLAIHSGATLTANEVYLAFEVGDVYPNLVSGELTLAGVDAIDTSEEPITRQAKAAFTFDQNVIFLRELTGQGFTLAGSLHPENNFQTLRVDLNGDLNLGQARLTQFIPGETIRDVSGDMIIEKLFGTFSSGAALPDDLVVNGAIHRGAFAIHADNFQAAFANLNAEFSTDDNRIDVTANAESPEFGPLRASGAYIYEGRQWRGTLAGDLPQASQAIFGSGELPHEIREALLQFGDSTFDTTLSLPSKDAPRLHLAATRHGEPPLQGHVQWAEMDDALVLDEIQASARLALEPLEGVLFERIHGHGQGRVDFMRDPESRTFETRFDLTPATVWLDELLEKKPEDPLVIILAGPARDGDWSIQTIDVHCLGESARFTAAEDGYRAEDLNLNLTPLQALLKDGGEASGRLTGHLALQPLDASLSLENAALKLRQDLAVDALTGHVTFRQDQFNTQGLRIQGARSECVLDASWDGESWTGRVHGSRLDVDALLALTEAYRAFTNTADGVTITEKASRPYPQVEFAIKLDEVHYRRGRLLNLTADLQGDENALHVRNLRATPYSGTATGTVSIQYVSDGPNLLETNLAFNTIDMRIIDDMLLDEPRDLSGRASGTLQFTAPVTAPRDAVNHASGRLDFNARDGSFGQLGWATRLLAVLRTTEIVRLRIPTLRDKGLTYETCSGKLVMRNGVITIEDSALASPSYAMTAGGVINYPADYADVTVLLRPLETVSRLVGRIPIVRDAVDLITRFSAVPVRITGSPYDATFGVVDEEAEIDKTTEELLRRLEQ